MQIQHTHDPQRLASLIEIGSRLLKAIEAEPSSFDTTHTTWILPLRHISGEPLSAVLEALKSERVNVGGTPYTLILAGPCAEVHVLGEVIIGLDQHAGGC